MNECNHCEKVLYGPVTLLGISEFTLERNHICVLIGESPSAVTLSLLHVKGFSLERSPMNVTTVGKLFSSDHSLCICKFILEGRNLINTVIVQKVSNRDAPENTLAWNPINVITMKRPFHAREKPYKCNECEKAFNYYKSLIQYEKTRGRGTLWVIKMEELNARTSFLDIRQPHAPELLGVYIETADYQSYPDLRSQNLYQ